MTRQYSEKELPVTLLAGCLGSGKTTLLNHILSQNHGWRIAVIENEFGEIPIDNDLIIGADDDIFEMSNGCVCCSVRTDLIETLGRLLSRQERFDAIVIEATGLASPGPIAQAFLIEQELPQELKLDGVITLIDCLHIEKQLEELEVAWEQVAFSSVLLLNKADLAGEDDLKRVEARVRGINPTAPVFRTERGRLDIDKLLNLGGFEIPEDFDGVEMPANELFKGENENPVTSVSLELKGKINESRFQQWLQMLLIMEGMDVFRSKGILDLPESEVPCLFQSVYQMYDSQPGPGWKGGDPLNRLVFIGRGLDAGRLEAGVRSCMV